MKASYFIYSDYSQRKKRAAVAFIIVQGGAIIRSTSVEIAPRPSVVGEIRGIIEALKTIRADSKVCAYSDVSGINSLLVSRRQIAGLRELQSEFQSESARIGDVTVKFVPRHHRDKLYLRCHRMARELISERAGKKRVKEQVAPFYRAPPRATVATWLLGPLLQESLEGARS